MCWGTGSIPAPSVLQSPVPITAPGQENSSATPIQIASGWHHHIALMSDGTVWGYGAGDYGQIGTDGSSNSFRQVLIEDEVLTDVVEVFAGGLHSCAKHTNGSLTCFGYDEYGQSSGPDSIFDGSSPATSAKLVAMSKHFHVSFFSFDR